MPRKEWEYVEGVCVESEKIVAHLRRTFINMQTRNLFLHIYISLSTCLYNPLNPMTSVPLTRFQLIIKSTKKCRETELKNL